MDKILTKIGIAFGTSVAVNEAVNLQPLWTALITLAVSLVTVFTYEGVSWLKSWFNKKKAKNEAEEEKFIHKKCEEADEIVQIADAEKNNKEE